MAKLWRWAELDLGEEAGRVVVASSSLADLSDAPDAPTFTLREISILAEAAGGDLARGRKPRSGAFRYLFVRAVWAKRHLDASVDSLLRGPKKPRAAAPGKERRR